MPQTLPPATGQVEILVLAEHRLALMRLVGDVTLPVFLAAIRAVHDKDPESASYHLVNDLRAHTGNLGVEGIKAGTAQRQSAWPVPTPAREVMLTRDAGMVFIARYLDLLAPHVEHSVTPDPVEAIARAAGGVVPQAALDFLGGP
ncbi:hypothetical protein ACFQS7_09730 [Dankookia sp. GCM10030260]|uniref:hypothetical protein n=1 Tax=Dankookia sp. GCM10030260 TaxID=3273390 RepID=UPI0036122E95